MADIVLSGVGGQGIVLASRLLAETAMLCGFKVRTAETIGMAQRGGCVASYVRIGESESPMTACGTAECVIGFEPAEAVRSLSFLKKGGLVIACNSAVVPVSAVLGAKYEPAEHIEYLKNNIKNLILADGAELASEIGSAKSFNIALIAAAVARGVGGLELKALEEAVKKLAKPQFIETNKRALAVGAKLGTI